MALLAGISKENIHTKYLPFYFKEGESKIFIDFIYEISFTNNFI